VPPPEIIVGVRENLMFLVNSYILKMAWCWNQVRNNQKAAIIEGLHAELSAMEIIRFFGYPRSTVWHSCKIYSLEQSNEGSSMPVRKSHSKECTARTPAVLQCVERTQALISDDPGQLRKLGSIVGVSEPTMRRIAEDNLR